MSRSSRIDEIASDLIQRISGGIYRVGENIPNELDLCAEFNTSRHTIREAVRNLENRGLVKRKKRSGTKIISASSMPLYGLNFESSDSLGRYLERTDLKLVRTVTDLPRQPAETQLDGDLADWAQLDTYRCAPESDRAISWSYIYLRKEFLGVVDLIGQERGGIYELLNMKYKKAVKFIDVEVSSAPFTDAAAKVLCIKRNSQALLIIRRFHGMDDELFEVSVSYYPPAEVQYKTRIKINQT
ncbi:GntR family transcriptional regulator [Roseovarius dicentrarchi]|uniref:GntR family transcriptional regulator n=1 Tax=Roseovarius dicentrarchi TaxID=2250573 RepID=UPI000DEA15D8|nr:GntR family transcriptional regulator [Roseovarius dicentrarchi]